MPSFLAPAAFAGAFLLAIPIVIHLFKPRKMRATPFSSLRWLRATRQRMSRRIRFHQWLLFLLRAGFISLLVLALAQPIWTAANSTPRLDRIIVLDCGRSLSYRIPGQPTPFDKAIATAHDLMEHQRSGDRTALLFAGSKPRLVTPLTSDIRTHLPALNHAPQDSAETHLSAVLPILMQLCSEPRQGVVQQIDFLTDNAHSTWSQPAVAAFVKRLPATTRIRIVDCGTTGGSNAWIAGAQLVDSPEDKRHLLRVDLNAVGTAANDRTLQITGIDDEIRAVAVTLEPGRPTRVEFDLGNADLTGRVAHLRLEPADALPDDDNFFLNLDHSELLQILLLEGPFTAANRAPGLALRTAIESLASEEGKPYTLTTQPAATVSRKQVNAAEVIVLADVPDLSSDIANSLQERVRNGAGLLIFLGDAINPDAYNERFYNPVQPREGLLTARLAPRQTRTDPTAWTEVRTDHRILARLGDPVLGDLAKTRFRTYHHFSDEPNAQTVLARMGDATPAIIESSLGKGRVILLNTSANDDWGTLSRASSFVPLIDRTIGYLAANGNRRSFLFGDGIGLTIPHWRATEPIRVNGLPAGVAPGFTLSHQAEQVYLKFDRDPEPGIYEVHYRDDQSFRFTVNASRENSSLAVVDPKLLSSWWEPFSIEIVSPEALLSTPLDTSDAILWPWLVGLAALLLLVETWLVHRACPRVTPCTTETLVRRRSPATPLSAEPGASHAD